MVQVIGFLPEMWYTWIEFPPPSLGYRPVLTIVDIWGYEPVNGSILSVIIPVSLPLKINKSS